MDVSILELSEDSSVSVTFSEYILDNGVKVDVTGTVTNKRDYYCFQGTLTTNLDFICDKCLKEVKQTIYFDMVENFSNNVMEGQDPLTEIWHCTDKIINLKPVIETNLSLHMPVKVVCSDHCKGLCHVCGYDLNTGEVCNCNYKGENIDPRFDCLRSLFQDKEV